MTASMTTTSKTGVLLDGLGRRMQQDPSLTDERVDGCGPVYKCRNVTFALSQDGTKLFVRVTDQYGRHLYGTLDVSDYNLVYYALEAMTKAARDPYGSLSWLTQWDDTSVKAPYLLVKE